MIHKLYLLLFTSLAGCSSAGFLSSGGSTVEVHSMGLDRVILEANCATIVCTEGFANEGDVWMTDIPIDQLKSGEFTDGQIIHLQVLWTPAAGKTPLSSTSTNLAIQYTIISNGNIGVYGGGGFCWKSGTPETGMVLNIEDATLAIQYESDGFSDLLTPATMSGRVQSISDQDTARQIANASALLH
ncbi:MAG: hypothetical protein ISR75_06625 [Phycisphaerales bacterium]|nr:hypothetical protein [Planctomycetota bacterium]MBL6998093.1 hypothetical protein [Phycisphaerales bacterium]